MLRVTSGDLVYVVPVMRTTIVCGISDVMDEGGKRRRE